MLKNMDISKLQTFRNKAPGDEGFTIVELLVTMLLLMIIMTILMAVFLGFYDTSNSLQNNLQIQSRIQNALNEFSSQASQATTAMAPVSYGTNVLIQQSCLSGTCSKGVYPGSCNGSGSSTVTGNNSNQNTITFENPASAVTGTTSSTTPAFQAIQWQITLGASPSQSCVVEQPGTLSGSSATSSTTPVTFTPTGQFTQINDVLGAEFCYLDRGGDSMIASTVPGITCPGNATSATYNTQTLVSCAVQVTLVVRVERTKDGVPINATIGVALRNQTVASLTFQPEIPDGNTATC